MGIKIASFRTRSVMQTEFLTPTLQITARVRFKCTNAADVMLMAQGNAHTYHGLCDRCFIATCRRNVQRTIMCSSRSSGFICLQVVRGMMWPYEC
jgi:hypothetical protein